MLIQIYVAIWIEWAATYAAVKWINLSGDALSPAQCQIIKCGNFYLSLNWFIGNKLTFKSEYLHLKECIEHGKMGVNNIV